jgi:hypothetical protein
MLNRQMCRFCGWEIVTNVWPWGGGVRSVVGEVWISWRWAGTSNGGRGRYLECIYKCWLPVAGSSISPRRSVLLC